MMIGTRLNESTSLLDNSQNRGIIERFIPSYTSFNQETIKILTIVPSLCLFGLFHCAINDKNSSLAYSSAGLSVGSAVPLFCYEVYHRHRLGWDSNRILEESQKPQPPSRFYNACMLISDRTLTSSRTKAACIAVTANLVFLGCFVGILFDHVISPKISSTHLIVYDAVLTTAMVISFLAFKLFLFRFQNTEERANLP